MEKEESTFKYYLLTEEDILCLNEVIDDKSKTLNSELYLKSTTAEQRQENLRVIFTLAGIQAMFKHPTDPRKLMS